MSVPITWRVLAAALWLGDGILGVRRLVRGTAGVRQIILDADGGVACVSPGGNISVVNLSSGSFIAADLAWLRLERPVAPAYTGLFLRSRVAAADWHRLQLIWQQSRQAFGHPGRP